MSADDFQTKYSSVMESMLKSAVAETTKLFETMVDELKEEICRMKKENDDLKTRCSHFEKARHQSAVSCGETERLRGPNVGPRRRDRAVQCDLVPFHTAPVEQCQPSMHSSVHKRNQQCCHDPMVSSLHDHTYGEANTRRALLFFKQEAIRKQQTSRRTRSLDLNEGLPQASVCRTRSKGPVIHQDYPPCKRIFPKKYQDARRTPELPCKRRESYLQGAQNLSTALKRSLTGSVKDNLQGESAASQISHEQAEIPTPEKHILGVGKHQLEVEPRLSVRSRRRRRSDTSVNKQADVTQQQNADLHSTLQAEPTPPGNEGEREELNSGVAVHEACPKVVVSAQCTRGRPRKKTKPIGSSAAALLASLSEKCSSEKQKQHDSQGVSKEMEEGPVQAPSSKRSAAILTPNTPTVQPRERRTSATLQDALLFVEAMNQSTVDDKVSTPQRVAASCVGTLETVEEVPPEQTPTPSVEPVEATANLPIAEVSATTQSTIETVDDTTLTAEATPVGKTSPQIKVYVPKRLCTVTPSSTTTSSEPIATVEVQTLSVQQQPPHPLPTSAKASPPEIFPATRLLSSLRNKIGPQSPTQLPNVAPTVAAVQKQSIPPNATTAPPSPPSVPQKMMYVMSSDLPSGVAPQSTATSSDTPSGTPRRPQLTIIVPREMSIKAPSQTVVPATTEQSVDSVDPVTVSQSSSSTEESNISMDTQAVSDETAAISPQNKDPTTENLESPKQTAAVEPNQQESEACSSLDMPLVPISVAPTVPQTTDQKLCAVVKLFRLPSQVLDQEAILVSTLPKKYFSQSQSIVLKDTTEEEPSPTVVSTQSSETPVLSTDSCPKSDETSLVLDVDAFQMPEEPNDVQEEASLSCENSTNLEEESPVGEPLTSEPTSNSEEMSFEMQDCASQDEPSIEETPSTSLIQLTPIITKDDPHLQMTKAQFLAQLSVTPVSQDPKEASSNYSVDVSASCSEQSTSKKKRSPKKSRMARLRSTLRTRLQARRKEGNPEPEPSTENPKEQSLEKDSPNDNTLTTGPSFPSLNDPEEVEDITSQNSTSNDADPISPRRSGQREAGARSKETVGEPTSVSSKILKVKRKSTPMSTGLDADGVVVKTKRSISASPSRSAVKESPRNTRSTSVSPRRSIAIRERPITKKSKSTYVSPRRSIAIRESPITKKTKFTSVSPRRSIAIKESPITKKTKSTPVSPRRSIASKESPITKKTKSTSVSPRRSVATKESPSIEKPNSTSLSPRRSITTKESPITKNPNSTSMSPRTSIAIKESPSTEKPKSTSVSPRRSVAIKESLSIEKPKSTSVSPRRSVVIKESPITKKTKFTSVSPRRSVAIRESPITKKTKSTPVSPRRSIAITESLSIEKTKSTSESPRRSIAIKESQSIEKTKSVSVSPRRSIAIKESPSIEKTKSTSVSPRRSIAIKESPSIKKTKSTSVSPRRSIAIKESPSIEKTKSTSVSPRRSTAIKESPHTRKARATSVSPRRSIATKESPSPKKVKFSSVTPRRSNSTKQNASSKKTKNISLGPRKNISKGDGAPPKNPKRTSLSPKATSSGVDAIPKTTKATGSPRTPSVQKKSTNPKVSTNESTSFCRRRCTFNKIVSYSYQNQMESGSSADGASSKNIKIGIISPIVKGRKTRETPPAKKPRLFQDGTGPKQNSTAEDAKNLDKVAKANVMLRRSSQSKLENGAKIIQLAENPTICENGGRITAKSVWTPPKMPAGKTPLTGRKEAVSPKSQEQPTVYPPSVSLTPIPLKAPPVVSPLQPLSVIGRHLLKNQCGECGRVLSSVAALESHVSLHAGRRPFSCTLCGKRFPDSKGLKRHGRVHRNGRIHVCQHCGKGFVYRFGLTKHLQMVHRKIKPFICQICNKGFFTKRDVEAHIRIHTGEKPFHCNLCEKKFARRVELNVHLRWHNGEKRHWCPFCGKGFLDFNNLKRHKFIHTGEKPHSCPHCPKNFTQSGHLKKHIKNVHKIL